MKQLIKVLSAISLMLFTTSVSFAQWETLRFIDDTTPLPWINSISFTDVNNGMGACRGIVSYQIGGPRSDSGAIIKTTDGGITWNNVFTMDSTAFPKIIHTSPNTAYCVGYNWKNPKGIIARTTDTGLTWDTTITSNPLYAVSFPSHNIGYVSGYNGAILKTTDAGKNWFPINSGVTDHLEKCLFLNDSVGFVVGDRIILKTTNGGLNWSSQSFGKKYSYIRGFSFPSFNVGYFILRSDSLNYIYKTTDNGNRWDSVSTINSFLYLSSICFPNDSIGYISGQFQMYKTIDDGLNWKRQYASPPGWLDFMDDLMDVFFLNADTGFAAGSSQFYRTFNGGDSIIYTGNLSLPLHSKRIYVYPNPSKGKFTITMEDVRIGEGKITVYNVLGERVYSEIINNQSTIINLSALPAGIYFLQVNTEEEIVNRKLVKE